MKFESIIEAIFPATFRGVFNHGQLKHGLPAPILLANQFRARKYIYIFQPLLNHAQYLRYRVDLFISSKYNISRRNHHDHSARRKGNNTVLQHSFVIQLCNDMLNYGTTGGPPRYAIVFCGGLTRPFDSFSQKLPNQENLPPVKNPRVGQTLAIK